MMPAMLEDSLWAHFWLTWHSLCPICPVCAQHQQPGWGCESLAQTDRFLLLLPL